MTRREWTVEDRFGRTWRLVVDGRGAPSAIVRDLAEASFAGPPLRSDSVAEALFAAAAAVGRERDTYEEWLRLPFDDASRLAADVRARLTQAESIGALIVEPVIRVTRLHYEEEEPPSRPKAEEAEPGEWIAIELVDEDGEPVPNMEFRIEGSSGDVHTGTTDASGMARVEGLAPGNCKVSFPNLNGPDWKKTG